MKHCIVALLLLLSLYSTAQPHQRFPVSRPCKYVRELRVYGNQPIIAKVPKGSYVYFFVDPKTRDVIHHGYIHKDNTLLLNYKPPGRDRAWLAIEGNHFRRWYKVWFKPAKPAKDDRSAICKHQKQDHGPNSDSTERWRCCTSCN